MISLLRIHLPIAMEYLLLDLLDKVFMQFDVYSFISLLD